MRVKTSLQIESGGAIPARGIQRPPISLVIKHLANIVLYPGWDIVARGISIKRSPFQYILLHYFHLCLQIAPGVLSRALPASLDGSLSSTGKLNVNSPISVPESTKQDEADWPENMHWVRCITSPPVDEIVEFGCTMMDYGSPPHERSSKIMGRDFPADEVTLENQARVIDLHPCFLQTKTGKSRLVCETVDQTLDESSVDAGLHALAIDLINGLPISINSELKFPPGFDRHLPRLVSIYPSGEEYHILMTDTTQKTPPLETPPLTPDHQRDSSKNRYIGAAFEHLPPAKATWQKAQGFLEGSLLIRCWFWLDEQTISVLTCALAGEAELSIIDFADSEFKSDSKDSDANEREPDGKGWKARYTDGTQHARDTDSTEEHFTKRRPYPDESSTNKTYLKQRSPPEILVDRWFLCWTGSGPKMLCEIPDWYTGDYHHPQSKHIRKATLQTHEGKVYTSLLPKANTALHFLVDSPPLWQRCRPTSDPKSHVMRCVDKSTNQATTRRNRATKSSQANQTFHRKSFDPSTRPLEKGVRIVSNESSHNITSLRCGPGRTSAFGKMGETFAFIGFFTVLVVFTIVLSWLVKHLFLAIYDGLEEWTDSRRRKRTLATGKDFGIGDSLNNHAPAYDSTGCGFQRPVNTVPFPQAAVMNEEATAAISTTGSQTLDGGSDSIKRKKAAMRATVSEEVES